MTRGSQEGPMGPRSIPQRFLGNTWGGELNGRPDVFKHAENDYLDIKEKSDPRDLKTLGYVDYAQGCIFLQLSVFT